ncbi:MAG: hydantoinase B/oxoprolinase family protein [Rhodospirillaceae bacterium]|nr:hydantoinase B/oxoprolinase family protein [Rhodospirillaceae bacterium]
MSDTLASPSALDDLLKSSRDQFERAFEDRLREANAAGLRGRSERRIDNSPSPVGSAQPDDPDVDALLNKRFGNNWFAELVETKITGGQLSALYRLTVDDRSVLEFGDALLRDGEQAALDAARQKALTKAAEALAHGARPSNTARPSTISAPSPGPVARTGSSAASTQDSLVLDRIEAAWRQIRKEAGLVLGQMAVAESARRKANNALSITDSRGAVLVGGHSPAVETLVSRQDARPRASDVYLVSDPYGGGTPGSWTVIAPIFSNGPQGDLVGFCAASAPMVDSGGQTPGSAPVTADSVFAESLQIPLMRIYEDGVADGNALTLILKNTRHPNVSHADLRALTAAAQTGAHGVADLCARFGIDGYRRACAATIERTNRAVRKLIAARIPKEPKSFEDVVDDDGCGNGPFTLKVAIWREGNRAFVDWTGTSAQAPGPINLNLDNVGLALLLGGLLIKACDPEIAINHGLTDLFRVTVPDGSLLRPTFPAPQANQAHTLARVHDVLNGVIGQFATDIQSAAGYGSSPNVRYLGKDTSGRPFHMADRVFGGTPAWAGGDGADGRSLSADARSRPTEQVELDAPVVVEKVMAVSDSAGPGAHRGGSGVEKTYCFRVPGVVNWRDDRDKSRPWGAAGGDAGQSSAKIMARADGTREVMPSKVDNVLVAPGDRLIFRTAGGGGWGHPLDRTADAVRNDVRRGFVSTAAAKDQYGVVLTGLPETCQVDRKATQDLRETLRRSRGAGRRNQT